MENNNQYFFDLQMPAFAPMLNREKDSKEPKQGKYIILCHYVCCTLSSFKNRSKLIGGIFRHSGLFRRVGVNSTYPALQKINSGRSTARAFPFLCDLKTVVRKQGWKRHPICSDGTHLFQRQRKWSLCLCRSL